MARRRTIDIRDDEQRDDQQPEYRSEESRGRQAESPMGIPFEGWKDVVLRTKNQVRKDNVTVLAAGVAFYFMLSLFPFAIAGLSIYGLVADPQQVTSLVDQFRAAVPDNVANLIESQLTSIAKSSSGSLTLGLVGSIVFGVWSASKGASALIKATNIAYDEGEKRGFVRLRLLALAFTLGFLVVLTAAVAAIAVLPSVLAGVGGPVSTVFDIARWPLLALIAMIGLAVVYRFAPNRDDARWEWVSLGAIVGTAAWLIGSALFSFYADNFGGFNETYGSLSAFIVLLLWLNLTAFAVLLGAEINAETEHQTRKDSTEGDPEAIGDRGAHVADTVGAPAGSQR